MHDKEAVATLFPPRFLFILSVIKQKGESQRVFQENKAHQIFRKTNIPYSVRRTRFLEILACFVFLKYPFWDSPFCLITDDLR